MKTTEVCWRDRWHPHMAKLGHWRPHDLEKSDVDVFGSGISPNKHGKMTSMTFPNIESPSRGQQLKSSVFSCFEIGCFVLIVSNNLKLISTILNLLISNFSEKTHWVLTSLTLFRRRHAHLKAVQMWIKNTRNFSPITLDVDEGGKMRRRPQVRRATWRLFEKFFIGSMW